ncbi:Carboxylic ester hydrolase [Mycena venus]|uniref:Carboxylic ester hydrolase n=1 Tax=Mycena venus TaxID=2733690 RepID=A0A8H7CP28_9AGAR|nr:Carboxylic ester hydrolase [Mycena venus]
MISLFVIPLLLLVPDFATADSSTVSLSYGTFRGFVSGNLTQFLGVPFARAARFQVPEEPELLRGLQNATSFGPACPQQALSPQPVFVPTTYPSISEDCLTLNVFKPTVTEPTARLPVLVWIYGGGFQIGNSRDIDVPPVVERSIDIGEPILVVTPNYRLSALGFLAGKEAQAAGISNLGLRDQISALKWVQKHISAFGGDPNRVVIGGLSAGAVSASFLSLNNNQNSNVLFRGAFLQSGHAFYAPPLSAGQFDYDELVAANNCTASNDTLECLRRVPFESFMATVNKTADFFSYRSINLTWGPRVDGDVIVRDPWVSISRGSYAKIPVMTGLCDDEGTYVSSSLPRTRLAHNFLDYVHSNYLPATSQDQMAQISHLYPDDPTQGSPFGTGTDNQLTPEFKRVAAFQGDLSFTSPRRFFLEHASSTQNVWGWVNKRGKSTNGPLGAFHASDTPIWYTTNETTVGIDAMTNFINTLDPNCHAKHLTANTSIFWPKWNTPSSSGSSSLLTFTDAGINITAENFRLEAIEFLNDLRLEEATGK